MTTGSCFFGLQVTMTPADAERVAKVAGARREREGASEQRARVIETFAAVRNALPGAERGAWLWEPAEPAAGRLWSAWCDAGAERWPAAAPGESPLGHVAIAVLAADGTRAAGTLRALAAVDDDAVTLRATFDRLLRELHKVDWSAVRGELAFARWGVGPRAGAGLERLG